jgi:UDP-N-acetylglucosamine acyltransferase
MAMVGACTKVVKDVPPYVTVDGNPARVAGINITGLRRNNVPSEIRDEIRKAYKILYRSNLNTSQAIEVLETSLIGSPETEHFIGFLKGAERGIVR